MVITKQVTKLADSDPFVPSYVPCHRSQKYQARGQGRFVGSAEDAKDLKRARKEGKLGEAMLERRMKLKRYVRILMVDAVIFAS